MKKWVIYNTRNVYKDGENKKDNVYEICRLEDGKPELFDHGGFMIACTGKGNKGIKRTGKYYVDKRFRKEKLKRILNAD